MNTSQINHDIEQLKKDVKLLTKGLDQQKTPPVRDNIIVFRNAQYDKKRNKAWQKNDLSKTLPELLLPYLQYSSSREEGDMYDQKAIAEKIDNLTNRLNSVETKVAVIEERTGHLDKKMEEISTKISSIPSKDEIRFILQESLKEKPSTNDVKVIIEEEITTKKVATQINVENQVLKAKQSLVRWTVGTTIAVASLLFTALKLFL